LCALKKLSEGDDYIILLLYMDDMLIVDYHTKNIQSLKQDLSNSFAMKNFGYA